MDRRTLSVALRGVAAVMLLLALGSWDYSYYQILRLVIFGISFFLVWHLFDIKQNGWAWAFIFIGIIFNPIAPIYLDRSTWQVIDFSSAVLFIASLSGEEKRKKI